MDFQKISLCYFPTRLLLVDDEKNFLQQLYPPLVGKDKLLCQFYSNPQQALNFINKNYKSHPIINRCTHDSDDSTDHYILDFDIRAIRNEIYNPHRFEEVTLVVVDYAMPNMSGAEFCQQLEDKAIKKLMLTGEGDQALAVQLFNEGIIHKFILKSSINLIDVLRENIKLLQMQTFLELYDRVLRQSENSFFKHLVYCFSNPTYIKLFNNFYNKSNAVEFYLLDNQGSFLFLDEFAKPSWFIVVSAEEMRSYLMIAEDGDETPAATIRALRNNTHIPYFHSDDDWQTPPRQWQSNGFLHAAQQLGEGIPYYYAYIQDSHNYQIQSERILCYHDYLEKHYQSLLD